MLNAWQAIRARCPELGAAVRHVAGFARMIKDLSGDQNTLTKWISAIDADLPALRSLTTGLCRDRPSTGDLTIAHRRPGPRPVSEAETPGPAGKLKTAHPRKTPS